MKTVGLLFRTIEKEEDNKSGWNFNILIKKSVISAILFLGLPFSLFETMLSVLIIEISVCKKTSL